MKKSLKVIILGVSLCVSTNALLAQDLLPSESYYNENIAVNDIATKAPELKGLGDGGLGPGGSETGGGGWVGAPVGDALYPILFAGIFYASFLVYRNRTKKGSAVK